MGSSGGEANAGQGESGGGAPDPLGLFQDPGQISGMMSLDDLTKQGAFDPKTLTGFMSPMERLQSIMASPAFQAMNMLTNLSNIGQFNVRPTSSANLMDAFRSQASAGKDIALGTGGQ